MRKISLIAAAAAMTAGSLSADIQIGKGLTVGGFLDMTYGQTEQSSTVAGAAKTKTAGFNVATAEIDFMMDFGNGLTSQVDLEGNIMTDNVTPAAGAGNNSEVAVEQARIDYAFGQSTLTLGKFDTFIGLEGLEAPDLYQYSNSLTWGLEATQHEGIAYAYDGGMWNVAAALANGIYSDNGNGTNGSGKKLSYAFHAGVAPTDSLSFNANYAIGKEEAGVNADVTLFTVDASYSNHGWTIGAEYVKHEAEVVGTGDNETDAWMIMANYMFTERFGLTGRYSVADETAAAAGSKSAEAKEFTVAASYAFTPNWSGLIEYRSESVDGTNGSANAFTNLAGNTGFQGNGTADADIITVETILTF